MTRHSEAELMEVAHAIADAARAAILPHFRAGEIATDNKGDESWFDPVTVADRAAETAMRRVLAERRPDDGILGEEHGSRAGTSGLTWVLDPIDGTRGFICGTPTWGVLIALNDGARPIFGLIDQPYTGERFIGGFGQAVLMRDGQTRPLAVRRGRSLASAHLLSTFPEIGLDHERRAFGRARDAVALTRYGMDCYGYALLALGQVDLVIEAGLQPYDIQAPIAVIEAAGGIVTDWEGGDAQAGGQVLAAASPELHRAAIALLDQSADG